MPREHPAPRERPRPSAADILLGLTQILRDAKRYLDDGGQDLWDTLGRADSDARQRELMWIRSLKDSIVGDDEQAWARLDDAMARSPTLTAGHLAFWLVARADCSGLRESLNAAVAAAEQRDSCDPLTQDLAEFVDGYATGAITDAEFTYRQEHPRARYDVGLNEWLD